ncbi:hydrolase, carbon-nitrogen family protein [Cladophialophora carrionii]|uniref:Hydrolase, carbon-nitrogen family protein n=1 Tax=Cladophialophora carrionii TaxID=86049 RepID=A0A1C1CQ05_9EURO|nr:hydrolase, carbon-nitrogen family protein [Cladophialophora carrionii]
MKIATLQFSPRLAEVAANFSRAESLLMRQEREGELKGVDLLVLPELAFTAIAPFLEPTAAGPSTRWAARTAQRLKCTVAVGYPEAAEEGNYNTIYDKRITAEETGKVAYNSLVFVGSTGDVVAHYRKSFLYYTDETWAQEGQGFWAGVLPIGGKGQQVKAAAGICMDINPYKFEAPWTAYEFGNHAREARAKVVVISMAWLTRLSADELASQVTEPDHDTLHYWIDRLMPLFGPQGAQSEAFVVCANRTGDEGIAPRIGEVRYAGSSCVMGITKDGRVRLWDVLGRAQEGVLVVDTDSPPRYSLTLKQKTEPADLTTTDADAIPPV